MTEGPGPQPCIAIFEGGGAKGITHAGALKALERAGFTMVGVAGTSAGAIIAGLTAVGYTADELLNPTSDSNILKSNCLTPISLFGKSDWANFVALRKLKIIMMIMMFISLLITAIVIVPLSFIANLCGFRAFWRSLTKYGFFTTELARNSLNELLRNKLKVLYADMGKDADSVPSLVRFKDMDPTLIRGCIALKIIATNLSKGSLEIFSYRTHPETVVADAVAASFAIPFFFRAAKIKSVDDDENDVTADDLYADGGLVSNLPAWVFAQDKRIIERGMDKTAPPIPIIAFTLEDDHANPAALAKPWNPSIFAYSTKVIQTAIFGGQSVVQNFIPDLTVISLKTPLSLLEFDCTRAKAYKGYDAGQTGALARLRRQFSIRTPAAAKALKSFVDLAIEKSAAIPARAGAAPLTFRASLVAPFGSLSFKVVAAVNMENDADDNLVLDLKNPGAPAAFVGRFTTFLDAQAARLDAQAARNELRMTKYEQALVRPTLASVISIPIFRSIDEWSKPPESRVEPAGVLCLDSDTPLVPEYHDVEFMRSLSVHSILFAELMETLRND